MSVYDGLNGDQVRAVATILRELDARLDPDDLLMTSLHGVERWRDYRERLEQALGLRPDALDSTKPGP